MSVSTALPKDDPRIVAWEAYRQTDEFKNSRKWAQIEAHVEGSLWTAFEQGWRAYLTAVGQKAGTVGEARSAFDRLVNYGRPWKDGTLFPFKGGEFFFLSDEDKQAILSALIPAPSVAEAAEPVAWGNRLVPSGHPIPSVEPFYDVFLSDGASVHVFGDEAAPATHPAPSPTAPDGLASDPICRMCATQEHGSPRLPEECRCGDYPAVPDGLEALVERLRERWEATDAPVAKKINRLLKLCREAADAITALIAERDEALRLSSENAKLYGEAIERAGREQRRAETAERDLSAADGLLRRCQGVIGPLFSDTNLATELTAWLAGRTK